MLCLSLQHQDTELFILKDFEKLEKNCHPLDRCYMIG